MAASAQNKEREEEDVERKVEEERGPRKENAEKRAGFGGGIPLNDSWKMLRPLLKRILSLLSS